MPSAIKATYSLDKETLARLERLAHRWRVSKTEVIRRAVAKVDADVPSTDERIAALHELQRLTKERRTDLKAWQRTIKDGRR